jgi:hypothetical protein
MGVGIASKQALSDAQRMFETSDTKKQPLKGRGKIDLENADLRTILSTKLRTLLQAYTQIAVNAECAIDGEARLAKLMVPDIYALTAKKTHIIWESASLAALR